MLALDIINNLKNLRGDSDDTHISDMNWLFILDYYRAMLIRQQQRVGQSINPFIKQGLEVNLKKEDCFLVSTISIPKPIELHNSEMITSVGNNLQRTTSISSNWDNFSKYTSKEPRWFIKANKLYLSNYYKLKVKVGGVWENPLSIEEVKDTYNPLFPLSFEYPISATMLDQVYKLIIDTESKLSLLIPNDNINNSIENS